MKLNFLLIICASTVSIINSEYLLVKVDVEVKSNNNTSAKNRMFRIINGEKGNIKKYPYLVSMGYGRNHHLCGGSILNKWWILTAHHCIDGNKAKNLMVTAGISHLRNKDKAQVHISSNFS